MVDKKISELTVATTLTGVELAGRVGTDNARVPASLFNLAQHSVAIVNGAAQAIDANTVTKLTCFTGEDWNPLDYWDVTNQKFQPQKEGLYLICLTLTMASMDDGARLVLFCNKNGSSYAMLGRGSAGGGGQPAGFDGSILIPMNGTTDYLEFLGFHANASTTNTSSEQRYSNLSIIYVGSTS